MLNLSDKELDRLSREAADQHEPGDLTGPRSWDRLELRLDKELGRLGPSPLRGVRRLTFYYAPVILLLVGVTYYFVRSGSPPMPPVAPTPSEQNNTTRLSPKTSEYNNNSTSTPHTEQGAEHPASGPATGSDADYAGIDHPAPGRSAILPGSARPKGDLTGSRRSTITPEPTAPQGSTDRQGTNVNSGSAAPGERSANIHAAAAPEDRSAINRASNAPGDRSSDTRTSNAPGKRSASTRTSNTSEGPISGDASNPNEGSAANSGRNKKRGNTRTAPKDKDLLAGQPSTGQLPARQSTANQLLARQSTANWLQGNQPATTREPELSLIHPPSPLARSRGIDDSALRAFALKGVSAATPIRLDKKKDASLQINRPLQFGFSFAPDFASVNSLAGDRPGSSIGLTMDYQFLNKLYLSTGLLLTRKNYAASPDNYHAPSSYYRINNLRDLNLIKGSFYMLEIPLNLRYDFHLSSNTTFFVSGGASSYLLTSEHSQYYYDFFGIQMCQNFDKKQESGRKNYLFSTVNLSVGVETGLSNTLSLLIAPYAKIPNRGIGMGQVQITSVGINFALKYAPVLSRKRH